MMMMPPLLSLLLLLLPSLSPVASKATYIHLYHDEVRGDDSQVTVTCDGTGTDPYIEWFVWGSRMRAVSYESNNTDAADSQNVTSSLTLPLLLYRNTAVECVVVESNGDLTDLLSRTIVIPNVIGLTGKVIIGFFVTVAVMGAAIGIWRLVKLRGTYRPSPYTELDDDEEESRLWDEPVQPVEAELSPTPEEDHYYEDDLVIDQAIKTFLY